MPNIEAEIAALDLMLGSALTRSSVDNARAVLAVRTGMPEARGMVLAKRRQWLVWLTLTQREWQGKTRRPNRAKHHDSISIRESYVRAGG